MSLGGRPCILIAAIVAALAITVMLWSKWLAGSADPPFAEDPAAWAGAPGATMGPEGPIPVPGITGAATTRWNDDTVRELAGLPYREVVVRLGRPPEVIAGAALAEPVLVWAAAVHLRRAVPGQALAAHLRLDCSKAPSAPIETAIVRRVSLLGTFGKAITSFPVSGGAP